MKLISTKIDPCPLMSEVSFDAMLKEAMSIGRVKLDQDWNGAFEAQIRFDLKSGTTIYAKGKNTDPWFAMADALNEARSLGAGG